MMPRFMNGWLPSVHMEDLEAILTERSVKLAHRRTFLLILALFIFLVILSLSLLVAVVTLTTRVTSYGHHGDGHHGDGHHGDGHHDGGHQVCVTAGCLHTVAGIMDSADLTADPCEDFHQFACGGWVQRNTVPPDRAYINVFDHLFSVSEEKLRDTLESPVTRRTHNSSERKMKDFFSLCVHDYRRMRDSGRTLIDDVIQTLGGLFILNPQSWTTRWSFKHALVKAHTHYSVPALFNYYVSPDPEDRMRNIIGIQLPPADFDTTLLADSDTNQAVFRRYIRALGALVLRDADVTMTLSDVEYVLDTFEEDVYRQELQLTKLRTLVDEMSQWEGKVVTLSQLAANLTQVDWFTIITSIFEEAGVTGESSVAITSLPYFQGLDELLANTTSDGERRMNNYLVWMIVHTFADHLSWDYRQLKYDLIERLTGRTEFPSTWHACLSLMKVKMGFALAVELAKAHKAHAGSEEVGLMVERLKASALLAIDNADWMDTQTRDMARTKMQGMQAEIGFPPVLSDESEVDKLYSKLQVNTSESFLSNLLSACRFKSVLASIEYVTGYKYNLWEYAFFYNPLGVRPLYLWFYNTLIVPPGVFSLPLFSQMAPQSVNYGALGSYVAARMIRSVDEVGRLVQNGTFTSWWTSLSLARYLLLSRCYLQYFDDKTSGPYHVNGRLVYNGSYHPWWSDETLEKFKTRCSCYQAAPWQRYNMSHSNETVDIDGHYQVIRVVAETAGLRLAYSAYQAWIKAHQVEPRLPGLNMTSQQIFFLAAAQARCTLRRDQSAYKLALSGALPVDTMLNTMMSHVEAFSEAYSCKPGSPMRPQSQCQIFTPDGG